MTTAVPIGTWLHNPVTGELAELRSLDSGNDRMEGTLWLQPGAAVARPHVHDHLIERFEVLDGEVGFVVGGAERVVAPGAGVVEVPAGVVHDWWNAGDGIAQVRVEVEAVAAPGGAGRFVAMIQTLWSLGALGRVDAAGAPDLLWLAAIAREYRDVIRFVSPPAPVQAILFGPLSAVARATGRDPLAPGLHGPDAACVIENPGEEGRAALLGVRVEAGTARGR